MAHPTETARIQELHGADLYDRAGDKIGTIDEVFVDEATGRAAWLRVGTGFMGMGHSLVPAHELHRDREGFSVPYARETVKDAPDADAEVIDGERERELVSHYGLSHRERIDRAAGHETGRPPVETDAELTRHEEELKVGTREVSDGSVRLRKWVETEPVETEVELRRQEAVVHRERVDEPVGRDAIGEREHEVELRREEPVVEKETRARERVSVDRRTETETEHVEDELRKERVEVEEDRP